MLWLVRVINLFRRDRLDRELEEEMAAHLEEALEHGRDSAEARRSLGSSLHHREHSRDIKLIPWLDALASDAVFGWRQLRKHPTASAAAVLSLALAIGATTSAFRLIDAILLRRLPVADPDRLHVLATSFMDRDGHPDSRDDFDYPTFRRYSTILAGNADLILLGGAVPQDIAFGSSDQTERAYREFVSGNAFSVLGLRPAVGRLIAPTDDTAPGGHPVAVLSYDYWRHRFSRDPNVIGMRFQMGGALYQIIGVGPDGFVGCEPGTITDVFIPATMNVQALTADGWSWFRIWVRAKPGISPEQVREPLNAQLAIELHEQVERLDSDTPRQTIERMLKQSIVLLPGAAGVSGRQSEYRRPLLILAVLVALVLLIACANVGSLLSARAAARAREMALRVSIGAGQWRLIQLVLAESALLATFASVLAALFSSWSAPFVVSLLAQAEDPVRLVLTPDGRVLEFGILLAVGVTLLFGLAPALRASGVKPVAALKGAPDTHARRELMNALIAAQVAFCVLVLFVAGLFVSTFERLSTRPLGFAPQGLLIAGMSVPDRPQPAETWRQVAQQVSRFPGVQSAAYASWPPLSANHLNVSVRVQSRAAEPQAPYFLEVSPGYFNTMRIGWIDGRDFRPGDVQPQIDKAQRPARGVGIVNEAFARTYFDGHDPVGQVIEVRKSRDISAPLEIVGYVRDACYSSVREVIRPTVYVPNERSDRAAILIRASADPRALAPALHRELKQTRSELLVRGILLQSALVDRQMLRERLLATLSLFFAVIALALAAIGLYGVLNYSVVRRRREIGIRIALGARSAHVIRRMTVGVFATLLCGTAAGITGGIACGRVLESLLYEVKPGDSAMIVAPIVTLLVAAILAALPPAIRAVRIDPVQTLRE
jgi:predicted permease